MSINVYLITEKMKKCAGYKEEQRIPDKGSKWTEYRLNDEHLYLESGRYYFTCSDLREPISEELAAMIDEVSLYEYDVPMCARRQLGLYAHKSAVGTMDLNLSNKTSYYSVRIRGKNMADVKELYYLIRSGKILPKESWEEEQIDKPVEESAEGKQVEPSAISRWFSGLKNLINKF